LGLFVFLIVHYSFWLAVGIMYIGGMLIVAVITSTLRNRQTGVSNCVALDDKHGQIKVEEQTTSEDIKAA
jgi:hypothetical protein